MVSKEAIKLRLHYKFIHFHLGRLTASKVWVCRNNKTNDVLGLVYWYKPWRRWCFFPAEGMVFSALCLHDITDFIAEVNRTRADET